MAVRCSTYAPSWATDYGRKFSELDAKGHSQRHDPTHRGGQRTVLGSRRPGRRSGCNATRAAIGAVWQDHGLVFASAIGTPLDAANVRREFRKITETAGLGTEWAPRDLRHTFVSTSSADGVPIEEIARLAGHNRTATTELVYRHELRPVITTGAEVVDRILNLHG
jgi:site-specific recombinase XerD